MPGGGSCGCCSCGCCTREVERPVYVMTILSADETIEHWEAAVGAGKSLLWDALSSEMQKVAEDVIDEYEQSYDTVEKIILSTLDEQFEIIKLGKESILQEATETLSLIENEAEDFLEFQHEILQSKESE